MNKKLLFIIPFMCLFFVQVQAQTIINSLAELKSQLGTDNGNFKMTPGTYYFNLSNCGEGKLFDNPKLLLFTGNNSTFDFTDVKFEYDTEIFTLFGNIDIIEFWPVGANNVYLNLTMEDIGYTVPTKGAGSIHIDGSDNRVEGFETTTRGSFPYGYGDIFGKGGGAVIKHFKHSGILIRGDRNHIKNCKVYMRAYGHGIFVQGSRYAKIEGCYVEGELRTVGEVLQEEGTDSPADSADFETVWGFNLRDLQYDYTFSLQEAGIRAYSSGVIFDADGNSTDVSRGTENTTVIDCTIVQMRVGVNTGAEGGDEKRIENCTALACEVGFWLGHDGDVINCRGDASVGPLFSEDIGRSNATYELTLLDNYIPKLGNEPYVYFAGNNHNFTLHDGTTYYNPDIKIQVGGTREAHRWLAGSPSEPMVRSANNITLTNNTKYPVIVENNVSNSTIISCGTIINNGAGNTITQSTNCDYEKSCDNRVDNLKGACYDDMFGIQKEGLGGYNEQIISDIHANDWIAFNNVDLTNVVSVEAIASSDVDGAAIEVRQGSNTGALLATISVANTGSFYTYKTVSADLSQTVTGENTVCLVFTGGSDLLLNLEKVSFGYDECDSATYNPHLPISADSFCEAYEVTIADYSGFSKVVTDIEEGDYLKFSNVDFGYDDVYNEIEVLVSSGAANGGTIEVRSGAIDGELLATVNVSDTGSSDDYKKVSAYTTSEITGSHDVYFVFKGSGSSIINFVNFYFNHDECAGVSYNAFSKIGPLDYCEMFGVIPVDYYLGGINNGEWIRYASVDFTTTSPEFTTFNLSGLDETEGYVNIMLDHPTEGTLIATATAPKSGGWENWQDITVALNQDVTGVHEVYLYFGNGAFNFNGIEFHQEIVELDNLALSTNGAVASQSSTAYTGDASRANDGNTDGNFGGGSVSHTEHGTAGSLKWWQVDLGENKTINEIVVYNRTGGSYSENLNNYTVEVIKENGDVTFSQLYVDHPSPSTSINTGGVVGKIVKISKTSERGIQLAEVEVYGSDALSIGGDFNLGQIKVYPNPTTGQIMISNGLNTVLEVYNSNGALQLTVLISENNKVLSLENLSSGIHILKFKSNQGTEVKKLIVK